MSLAGTTVQIDSDLRRLARRHKALVQFGEYMVGGGVYFWSGMAVFALCYSVFGWDWLWAKMAADAIGWSLNFGLQRYWAFNSPQLRRHSHAPSRYLGLMTVNFGIDYAIVASLKYLGVSPYAGMGVSALFFTGWNYLWYRFWVFRPARRRPALD